MKISGSLKFVYSVIGVILVVWLGWKGYAALQLRNVVLTPINPGRVNVIAISPQAGYRIIVANQVAYLAKADGLEAEAEMSAGSESLANASRLPLRELIQTLQGDENALGPLLMRLNEWPDTDTSLHVKVWRMEDIEKALSGDVETQKKLEADLNVSLEGKPLDVIDLNAVIDGIIIDSPVSLKVTVSGKERTMTGRVRELFQPTFCFEVEERINDKFNLSDAAIAGIYKDLADQFALSGRGENVGDSLRRRIDAARLAEMGEPVMKVLDNTVVLLNEDHVTSAAFNTYDIGQNKTTNDITLGLSDDGRMRLWKYSHDHKGFQLLFVVDTVAIAAPRVSTELPESVATIRRVPSTDLVQDAVGLLNEILKEKK